MISPKLTKLSVSVSFPRRQCLEEEPERGSHEIDVRKDGSEISNGSNFSSHDSCSSDSCISVASVSSGLSGGGGVVDHSGVSVRSVRRRLSLCFDDNVRIVTIPRVLFEEDYDQDDDFDEKDIAVKKADLVKKGDLFYMQHEINLWRCEEKMRQNGIDPDNFDWRSMR